MTNWITSKNQKVHRRAMNRLVRSFNKQLEKDDLWRGRFMVRQIHSPKWHVYEDGSGAELFVHLEFIDRCTGKTWVYADHVNYWRNYNGYKLFEKMNWLIVEHWDVWKEPLARQRNFDAWREYNKNTRRV